MDDKNQSALLSAIRNRVLGEAARLYERTVLTQAGVLIVNLAAVLAPPAAGPVLLIATIVLAALWLYWSFMHVRTRGVGERARRAVMTVDGLGIPVDGDTLREMKGEAEELCPSGVDWKSFEQPEYYSSVAAPGRPRFAEMLHENVFWSAALHLATGRALMAGFVIAALSSCVFLLATFFIAGHSATLGTARLILTFWSFLISGEVLLRALRHRSHGHALTAIEIRLRAIRRSKVEHDVELLLALGDYNSEVEGAPMIPGLIYRANRVRLNRAWKI